MVTRREIAFGCRGITVTSDISILRSSVMRGDSHWWSLHGEEYGGTVATIMGEGDKYNNWECNTWRLRLAFLAIKSLLNADSMDGRSTNQHRGSKGETTFLEGSWKRMYS